jgi:hypothetical protein
MAKDMVDVPAMAPRTTHTHLEGHGGEYPKDDPHADIRNPTPIMIDANVCPYGWSFAWRGDTGRPQLLWGRNRPQGRSTS